MPPTLHARLGASSSKRWMNCPGSVQLSEGIADGTSVYALEGTAAHELGEMVIDSQLKLQGGSAYDYVGSDIEVDRGAEGVTMITVTEEMATAVDVLVKHVWNRYDELLDLDEDAEIFLERTFDLSPLNPPEPMFGTADVTIWCPNLNHLEVIDYKHGQGVVVEVERNSQLMMYGLGAAVSQGTIPATVTLSIVQPRVEHPDGNVRSYTMGRDELIEFKNELFAAAEATHEPGAPLSVGDWCKFCRARAVCPAQLQYAQDAAMVEFNIQPEPELADKLPTPSLLGMDQVADIVARAPIMMDWLRSVESHALTVLQHGGTVPGYKLVEGRTNRRWVDAERAEKVLTRLGMKKADRTTSKVISPNQAEKKLKALGLDPAKLEQHWEKPQGQPKMAPVQDRRPELPSSVEQDFGALTEPHPGASNTNDEQE